MVKDPSPAAGVRPLVVEFVQVDETPLDDVATALVLAPLIVAPAGL